MSLNKADTNKSGKQFFSGVMVLALSTFLVKLIGVLYKIPMMKYLGPEGMGYFNSAYEIYTLFFIISTAGLPVALSIMISENKTLGKLKNLKKIFYVSLLLLGFIGLLGATFMAAFSDKLSLIINNREAKFCILAISPTVFFICISSAIRGYFQGNQIMWPTAISQVIESVGKLGLGLTFAIVAINKGYSMTRVAAYAVLGLTIGVAVSMLFLIICKLIYKPRTDSVITIKETQPSSQIIKRLLAIAIPITLSSAVMSMTRIIDMAMILNRLVNSLGYSESMANEIYGSYSTMAVSVYNLPTTLITAVALPIVPMLTSALESGDRIKEKSTVTSAIKLTALVAFPSTLGIAVFSKPILQLLFSSSPAEVEYVAPLLSILGISVFLSCMITLTNAILQAYKMVNIPIISMLAGAMIKIVVSFVLIGIKEVNIYGAPISTFFSTLTIVAVNIYFIVRKIGKMEGVGKLFARPFFAAFLAMIAGVGSYVLLETFVSFGGNVAIVIMLVALIYMILALKLGAIDKEDIQMLPLGEKIVLGLEKIKLL